MNYEEAIKRFSEENLILSSQGFGKINESNLEIEEIISKAKERKEWLITTELIEDIIKKKEEERNQVEVLRKTSDIPAKELASQLKIYQESDVTEKSTSSGKVEDFLEYFLQKYRNLEKILKNRENLNKVLPVNAAKKHSGEEATLIVMISDKRESKKGYKFLDVEDPTGELTVLIPKEDRELQRIYEETMLDEVIAIRGFLRGELFIAKEIMEPELPVNHKPTLAKEDVNVALLSDTHVGSKLFMEEEFEEFIQWLNLKRGEESLAKKVKYVVIGGDLVDGIGVYPGQENDLSIMDIYQQYEKLAELIEKMPPWIEVILTVGNHDAVRRMEPQPALDKDIAPKLHELPKVHLTGNPVWIELHGVKILVYHGTSLDTVISSSTKCTYSRPETAMVEYLKKRYLVPSYGNDFISPEKDHYLIVKEIPDILHCGHVHTNGYSTYRGVKIINSGTFQERTEYQERQGHVPTPGKVPIVNLKSGEVSLVNFQRK